MHEIETIGPIHLEGTELDIEMQLQDVYNVDTYGPKDRICDLVIGHHCGLNTTFPMMESSARLFANWILRYTNPATWEESMMVGETEKPIDKKVPTEISYDSVQLDRVIKFILANNKKLVNPHMSPDSIRQYILKTAIEGAVDPTVTYIYTGGIMIIYVDQNEIDGKIVCTVQFYADLSVGVQPRYKTINITDR